MPQAPVRNKSHYTEGRITSMPLPKLLWVLIAFTCLGLGSAQTVTQTPPVVSVQEGQTATLNCKYSTSDSSYYLFWYKQPPGGKLIFLIRQDSFSAQNASEDRYSINFQKAAASIRLLISASQLGDSAVYFCALQHSVSQYAGNKLTFGKGTYLTVIPDIQNPQPALYQLRSPKSSNTSVCLLTDFDKPIKNETVAGSKETVLEMMTMESKSYGAVAWGSKSNFTCTGAFQTDIINFTQTSGSTCNPSHAEQSFETDRDLNLMNLSLIVLRIIFLKTVGFNLLMTLRLWSN
ncbi:T cell receptor alpha chain MC.7.G5-like [Gracilinanus agilis]|uniref:T cell receptor alpha chain MC.7.G5-like n=1 Tax=Gracilinanus agilis TaxID=191870 RepID=UPI001CFDD5FE|nr:T cell receptor alpha chain MC.7.G5-like [Gracilinanus agilis]